MLFSSLRQKYILKKLKNKGIKNISAQNDVEIDVFIPVVEKDQMVLPLVIQGIRNNILHRIGKINIIAPESQSLQILAKQFNCEFIPENDVLPIRKVDIQYTVNGVDRAGWLYQQLLKLSVDQRSTKNYFLIVDADTIFLRPQIFIYNMKTIFNCSDEYHKPYFLTYKRLLQEKTVSHVSFVSHHMLFERKKLESLRKRIELVNNTDWYKAIINKVDINSASGFSEYETYGNYVMKHYSSEVILEYWFNTKMKRRELDSFDVLKMQELAKQYKSVSFQSYDL